MNDSSPSKDEMREMAPVYRPSSGLELPNGAKFDSRSPRLSTTEFAEWCQEMMKSGVVAPEREHAPRTAEFKL